MSLSDDELMGDESLTPAERAAAATRARIRAATAAAAAESDRRQAAGLPRMTPAEAGTYARTYLQAAAAEATATRVQDTRKRLYQRGVSRHLLMAVIGAIAFLVAHPVGIGIGAVAGILLLVDALRFVTEPALR